MRQAQKIGSTLSNQPGDLVLTQTDLVAPAAYHIRALRSSAVTRSKTFLTSLPAYDNFFVRQLCCLRSGFCDVYYFCIRHGYAERLDGKWLHCAEMRTRVLPGLHERTLVQFKNVF